MKEENSIYDLIPERVNRQFLLVMVCKLIELNVSKPVICRSLAEGLLAETADMVSRNLIEHSLERLLTKKENC